MLKLGNNTFPHGLILAPMAGFTDHATRASAHAAGAELTITEMVSAKAVCYGDKKTPALARLWPEDGPASVQLFGSEAAFLAEAASRIEDGLAGGQPPVAIDLNAGCPVPKVAGNGEGSALMRDPSHLAQLIEAMVKRISLPVTVKIRTGWDREHINAPEVARAAEAGGASYIAVHGRTRTAMYGGEVDRATIAAVKAAVKIPVIANGDITDAASALSMLRDTGADGLMIGRGALGNPYLFSEIAAALDGTPYTPPTANDLAAAALSQFETRLSEKGEDIAVRESRKQLAFFVHGFPDAAALRARIHMAETADEMRAALADFLAARLRATLQE